MTDPITCCTCFEEIATPKPFPCGHHMHETCINEHLSKPECPLCRRDLTDFLSNDVVDNIREKGASIHREYEAQFPFVRNFDPAPFERLFNMFGLPGMETNWISPHATELRNPILSGVSPLQNNLHELAQTTVDMIFHRRGAPFFFENDEDVFPISGVNIVYFPDVD
jgi:hypothetical protein